MCYILLCKDIKNTVCHRMNNIELKWKVAELLIEFEKYDDLKTKLDDIDEDLYELDDDLELNSSERSNKQKIKNNKRKTLELIKNHEKMLVKNWNFIKEYINNDAYIKKSSGGDSYFITSALRVKKEVKDMMYCE